MESGGGPCDAAKISVGVWEYGSVGVWECQEVFL